jgi:phospholipase/carboxylesterase
MELLHAAHVPAGDGPFPTILALHGWGASAHDLLGLAPIIHGGQALVLCPEGPMRVPIAEGIEGHGWFPLGQDREVSVPEIRRASGLVAGFLEAAAERYPIDRRKTAVLGFSQGGVLAYDLALRDPERFAGLIALSSWLPGPLGDEFGATPEHADLPTFVAHGTEDPLLPVALGQESRDRLIALGVSPAYREYPMQHEIRPEALRDLIGWLEDKVLQPILLA